MKRHWQTRQVFAAEDACIVPGGVPWSDACALVKRVCKDYGLPVPHVLAGNALCVSGDRVVLPRHVRHITILHSLAHLMTDPAFPPHGAEFVKRWVDLMMEYDPAIGLCLASELDRLKVHGCPDRRAHTARGNAAYKASHRRGSVVEVVLDDPPECKRGSIEAVDGDELHLGGESIPLGRLRYIYDWSAAR